MNEVYWERKGPISRQNKDNEPRVYETFYQIIYIEGLGRASNHFNVEGWPFTELGKKTASKLKEIFLAAVRLL